MDKSFTRKDALIVALLLTIVALIIGFIYFYRLDSGNTLLGTETSVSVYTCNTNNPSADWFVQSDGVTLATPRSPKTDNDGDLRSYNCEKSEVWIVDQDQVTLTIRRNGDRDDDTSKITIDPKRTPYVTAVYNTEDLTIEIHSEVPEFVSE